MEHEKKFKIKALGGLVKPTKSKMDDLIQEPTNYNVGSKSENNRYILSEPVKHSLIDIFKELKFGRPAASQKYLQRCIEDLERWESKL